MGEKQTSSTIKIALWSIIGLILLTFGMMHLRATTIEETAHHLLAEKEAAIINSRQGTYVGGKNENQAAQGFGVMTYKDGSAFSGNWENGHKQGDGELHGPNGDFITGTWEQSLLSDGQGKFHFSNGVYEGEITEVKMEYVGNGKGKLTEKQGVFK